MNGFGILGQAEITGLHLATHMLDDVSRKLFLLSGNGLPPQALPALVVLNFRSSFIDLLLNKHKRYFSWQLKISNTYIHLYKIF